MGSSGKSSVTEQTPYAFEIHDVTQTIPNNAWTRVAFYNQLTLNPVAWAETMQFGLATVAAGSNAAALPQATINVSSTDGTGNASADDPFDSSGWLAVRIGGTDRLVKFTGKTGTTFTGCTGGVGTMTTGDTVRQVPTKITMVPRVLFVVVADVAFAQNATGARAVRIINDGNGATINASGPVPTANSASPALQHVQCTAQPLVSVGQPLKAVEVWQNSGGALDLPVDGLSAPSVETGFLSAP